jgi:putative DNA primase/helicase
MAKHNPGGPLDLILSRLANVKKSGKGYMCSCPAHGGHDCLTVEEKDSKVLIHCFSGCHAEEVMHAIDLRMSDLFADSLNPERRREYEVRSVTSARDHAKLLMDIAAAQALNAQEFSPEDIAQLSAAQDRLTEANARLAELGETTAPIEVEVNPLLRHLSYDSDAALDRIASQQWLVDQVLPVDGFGVIYGPSGSYKSFVAMDLSACVASATKWHGNDTDTPGHVIYIGAEGATGLHLRKKAWEIRHQTPLKNLAILGAAVTINSAIECQHLIDLCLMAADELSEPIRLIVIDTLARSFEGEENSASDMGAFVRACDRIRAETGATVLVIHHSGKDADKGARGSSALRAACDFEFKVVSPGKKVTKITCTKAKDSDPFEDMDFKLEVVEIGRNDAKGRPMASLTLKKSQFGDIPDAPKARSAMPDYMVNVNNVITAEMIRTGEDYVFQTMARDAFFAAAGAPKSHSATKMHWSRGIAQLAEDGWIHIDANGKITRPNVWADD